MEQPDDNPLLSTKPSDSGINVALHPLVLLTASDQITRNRVRGSKQPTVGVLLGQQRGRQITVEHAFAAALTEGNNGFNGDWLEQRTVQCKTPSQDHGHRLTHFRSRRPQSSCSRCSRLVCSRTRNRPHSRTRTLPAAHHFYLQRLSHIPSHTPLRIHTVRVNRPEIAHYSLRKCSRNRQQR